MVPDLKPPLTGYSLWLEPDDRERKKMEEVICQLAQSAGTRSFRAHATLLGLLDRTPDDLPRIKREIERVVKLLQPFTATVLGLGFRETHFQSVFLPILPTDDLLRFQNHIVRPRFDKTEDPAYMPHFSMVYGNLGFGIQKMPLAQILLHTYPFPFQVPIKKLTLADVHGYPDQWKVIEEYPLT